MFNNKLQMDAIAEAVKKVMDEAELDETGFHAAAHAAAKEGLPHFMFQGKKYKTTAKSQKEAIEIDEEQKENHNSVDEARVMRMRPSMWSQSAAMTAIRRQKEYKDSQLAARTAADSGENPDHPANKSGGSHDVHINGKKWKTFATKSHADNVAKKIKGATVHSTNEETEYTFKDKLIESLKENKATGTEELFTDNNIGEMSDAQMKRREKIVMSMKDKQADFKKKYGARWKDVMYATATKMAMNEDGDCVTPPEAKKIAKKEVKGHEKTMHHKEEYDEIGEDVAHHPHHVPNVPAIIRHVTSKSTKPVPPKAKRFINSEPDDGSIGVKPKHHREEVAELDEKRGMSVRDDKEKEATDAAQQTLDFMKSGGKIQTEPKKTRKPRKIMKHTDLGRTYKSGYGEEVETDEEMLDETIDSKDKTVDMLRGRVKVSPSYDNEHKSYKVKLSAEDIMGDTGWVTKKGTQTDKSGATHTPMSRAKHLAQLALQRTKKK